MVALPKDVEISAWSSSVAPKVLQAMLTNEDKTRNAFDRIQRSFFRGNRIVFVENKYTRSQGMLAIIVVPALISRLIPGSKFPMLPIAVSICELGTHL